MAEMAMPMGSMQKGEIAMDSFHAKELCRKQQYQAVLMLYQQKHIDASWTCWDYYYYAYALLKTKQYAKGHEISRLGMMTFPQCTQLHYSYCWCLYYLYIQPYNEKRDDVRRFRKAADAILQYSRQEPYSPYTKTVWKVVDTMRGRAGHTAAEINQYLEKLDPDLLSAEERESRHGEIPVSMASERERWYSLRSRFLVKEERYESCISLCQEALRVFPQLHHDNEIWFSYRIALCQLRMGKVDEAMQIWQHLLQYHEHWIIYRGLFYGAEAKQDCQAMLQYGAAGMLAGTQFAEKIHFIAQLADILQKLGKEMMAFAHYVFIWKLREQRGWYISVALWQRIASYHQPIPSWNMLLDMLYPFWISCKHTGEEPIYGMIETVLPGHTGGFIKTYEGHSYYFKIDSLYLTDAIKGLYVRFYIQKGRKGPKESAKRAVDIIKAEEKTYDSHY